MTTTRSALADRMRAADLPAKGRRTFGERYVESEAFRRNRAAVRGPGPLVLEHREDTVLTSRELMQELKLRSYSDLTMFDIEGVPFPSLLPLPALVPGLVTTVDAEHLQVELAQELEQNVIAEGAFDGTPLIEADFEFNQNPTLQPVCRFGMAWPVTQGVLDQPGTVSAILDKRLQLGFKVGLESQILSAPAGSINGAGILSSDPPSVAFGGSDVYYADTLARAIASVQGAGFGVGVPISVVAQPTTLEQIRTQKDTVGQYVFRPHLFPDVVNWTPSLQVPVGTAVVGDFANGCLQFVHGGVSVATSVAYMDFMKTAKVMFKIESRVYIWVAQPSAFCLATGL